MANSLEESRINLHNEFEAKLGITNRYFQLPESIKLKYPCILYEMYRVNQRFADDRNYRMMPCYSVTIIDRTTNIDWVKKMLESFKYCSLERVYNADNLVHYSFVLYYL